MAQYDLNRIENSLSRLEDNLTGDYGVGDYAVDIGKGMFAGATDAVEETLQFGGSVLDYVMEVGGLWEGATGIDGRTYEEGYETDRLLWEPPRPKTGAGQVVEDITQFGVGLVGAGKFKIGQKLVSGTAKKLSRDKIKDGGKLDKVIASAGNSMASSMIAHNPYDERLSDIIEEYPSLSNPASRMLMAKDGDTEAELRFKMAVEDLMLTGPMEAAIFAFAKGAKKLRKAKTPDEVVKVTEETNSEIAAASAKNKKERQAKTAADKKARKAADKEAKTIADKQKNGEDTSSMPRPKSTAYLADDIDNGAAAKGLAREDHLTKNFKHAELVAKATAVGAKVSKKDTKRVLANRILEKTHPNGKKFTAEEPVEVVVKNADSGTTKAALPKKGFNAAQVKALTKGVQSPKDIQEVFDESKGGVRLFNRNKDGDVPIVNYNDDVTSIIQDTINAMRPTLDKIKGHKDTEQTAKEISELLSATTGLKADQWLDSAFVYGKTIEEATVVLGAIDSLLMESGARLHKIFADKRFDTNLDIKQKGLDELTHFNKLLAAVKQVETPIGRGLQSRKNKIVDADAMNSQAAELGGEAALRKFRTTVIASGGDIRNVTKAASMGMTKWHKGGAMGGEFFRSMILFNIKTHVTNTLSGFTETVLIPSERYVGSFLDWRKNPFGAEAKAVREDVYYHLAGLGLSFKDSIRMAKKSLQAEKNFLDPANTKLDGMDVQNKLTSGFVGLRKESLLGRNVDTIGKISRGSLRALGAEDEFFKQINYRARVFANAMREANALMQAGKLDKDGMKAFALKKVDESFDDAGRGIDKDSTQYSREVTFTEDLDKGSLALKLQQATQQHPQLQLILPFVRTPTNLIVRGVQRTPLAYALSRRYRETLKNGTQAERSQMLGRVALGTTLLGGMMSIAYDGKLTGAGPVDPAQNKLWRAAGNQPYSVLINGQWYSYNRFDPVMMPVGLMANAFDMSKHIDEPTVTDMVSTTAFALSQTIQDKAYLQGITNFLDAITVGSQQDMNMAGTWRDNIVSSFIPAAPLQIVEGVQRVTNEEGNYPELREAVGLVDKIRRRIPMLNEQLPPKYNWLTGEAITNPDPFSTGFPVVPANSKVTEVGTELMRLNYPFRGVPRTLEGIKLNSEQLAFWSKQMGSTKLSGKSMLDTITAVMRKSGYDKSDMSVYDGINLTAEIKVITEIMSTYRSKARAELLAEYPELMREYTARRANDRAGRQLLETNR